MTATASAENPNATRVFLAVSGLLTLALGEVVRNHYPDTWDPLGVRVALSATCLVALAATWAPRLRAHTSTLGLVVAILLQAWFLHVSHVNGMIVERALNAVMMVVVSIAFCRYVWQAVAFTVVSVVGIAWGYAGPGPAEIPQVLVQTVAVVLGASSAIAVSYRGQLEMALTHQTAHAQALALEAERRRHAEEEALQASRAKSAFLAHMSHELRTPLNAILGYGELVNEELQGTDAAPLRADMAHILTSGRHLLGLIDEILDLARIESGNVELTLKPVELAVLVQDCGKIVAPSAVAGGNRLLLDVPEELVVVADEARLRQVLLNLLSNAIKFTENGQVSVEAAQDDTAVHLTVRDTGTGIDAAALPTLFEPFVMVDGDRRKQKGTGLGLAICRELAQRMNGGLSVESELGVGSAFTVRLPVPEGYRLSQSTTSTV